MEEGREELSVIVVVAMAAEGSGWARRWLRAEAVGNMQNLLLESQGEEKKTEALAGYDERACLGGSAGG